MDDAKKPWCAYNGGATCNCHEGRCLALENRETIDRANLLLGYGLSPEEAADDFRYDRPGNNKAH